MAGFWVARTAGLSVNLLILYIYINFIGESIVNTEQTVDVAIIGAGTAGLYALREVRRAKKSFVLIDAGPLGTTCARVGCMPSKVALHAAELWQMRNEHAEFGISGSEQLSIDRDRAWQKVRSMRDGFAASGTGSAQRAGGEHLLMGRARFLEPTLLAVDTEQGEQRIRASAVIIATGSRPVVPGFLQPFADHCITTDDLFELDSLPQRLGVLGLGAIGLEMGLAMARLGVEVFAADMADSIAGIADPEVAAAALSTFGKEMDIHLGAAAALGEAPEGVLLKTASGDIAVDKVLVALGRRPNIDGLNLAEAGIELDERGMPEYDLHTMKIAGHPVFMVGDVNAQRTLMHEAADEGAMAGYNAARGQQQAFKRKTPLGIAFTQPDIVSVGARLDTLDAGQILIGTATTQTNGRSRILTNESGLLRIYADKDSGLLLGAAMVGPRGEHIGQLLAVALEQGMQVHQLLAAPFYHPVVEEMIQTALQDLARQLPHAELPLGLQAF